MLEEKEGGEKVQEEVAMQRDVRVGAATTLLLCLRGQSAASSRPHIHHELLFFELAHFHFSQTHVCSIVGHFITFARRPPLVHPPFTCFLLTLFILHREAGPGRHRLLLLLLLLFPNHHHILLLVLLLVVLVVAFPHGHHVRLVFVLHHLALQ